jgi:hypothetical protein
MESSENNMSTPKENNVMYKLANMLSPTLCFTLIIQHSDSKKHITLKAQPTIMPQDI